MTPVEHFQKGEGAKTTSALEEVGFQDAEELGEVVVNPSSATRSGVQPNMRNHLEVERPRPTSKQMPP